MAETIRCPSCGGLNSSDAQWCGQCLERFAAPEPEPLVEARAEAAAGLAPPIRADASQLSEVAPEVAPEAAATDASGAPAAATAPAQPSDGRAFFVTPEGIKWTCPTCDTPNPIESFVCSVCGTTFSQMVHPEPEMAEKDPNTAALVSLFFPGAGHGYLGLWGDAIARGIISLWVVAVALIAAFAGEQASGRLVTILFGLVAFGLWAVASHDAYRAARKEKDRVILRGRGYLFLVLGLLGLLLLILVGSALGAR